MMMKLKQILFLIIIAAASANPVFSQNRALNFDGIDDYIELDTMTHILSGSTNFTIEFWMKADKLDQPSLITSVALFAINTSTTPFGSDGLLITMGGANEQTGQLGVHDEGGVWEWSSAEDIGDNECHHIAYVRNGEVGMLYIDGVNVGTQSTNYVISSDDRFSIGQDWDDMDTSPSNSQFLKGEIDDFRIWNTSKSEAEIAASMNTELIGDEADLLLYYHLNQGNPGSDNTEEITSIDLSTNPYNGNLHGFILDGPTSNWVENDCLESTIPLLNNCLDFDGQDDYVFIGDVNNLDTSDFTIESWVYIESTAGNGNKIINKGLTEVGTPSFAGYALRASSTAPDEIEFQIGDANNPIVSVSYNGITTGQWHHVAGVRSGTNLYLYLDGILVAEDVTETIFNVDTDMPLAIGAIHKGGIWPVNEFMNGKIDEVRIWTTARSSIEINERKDCAITSPEPNLLAVYNLNEMDGLIASDSSGNANSGDLENGPVWTSSVVAIICLSGVDILTACDSLVWIDGITYTTSNTTATHTMVTEAGHDSTVTLNLTINTADASVTESDNTLTANATGAAYQWLDCNNDFTIISDETNQVFTAMSNGSYAVEVAENGCVDTSACFLITTVGIIEKVFGNKLTVYPNPTAGKFSIDLGATHRMVNATITDLNGKLIQSENYTEIRLLNLALEEPAGVYILRIEAGEKQAILRVIKE